MEPQLPERRTEERHLSDPAEFHQEIAPSARPVIMRGLVADWPSVQAGLRAPDALADHLMSFDAGLTVPTIVASPETRGRFFYNADLTGPNFRTVAGTITGVMRTLLNSQGTASPPAIAMQSLPEPTNLPGFARVNPNPLLAADIAPRLWIGNRATVQTHHDLQDNLACVVGGRRRFILFPPDQTANLYIGPLEKTPAGPPISMVQLASPDIERHPRFQDAWAAAEVAELEPGDALFIPYMWWHHVEALDGFSVLANYWWNAAAHHRPKDAMVHAMMEIRDLPQPQREAWRAMFDAFVFDAGAEPGDHLPAVARGVKGRLSEEGRRHYRRMLAQALAD